MITAQDRDRVDRMLADALADWEADNPGQSGDEVWYDLAVATAWSLIIDEQNPDLAYDFCQRTFGQIPHDLKEPLS